MSAVVMVAGCNDDDNSSSNNSGQQQTSTEKLTGTAATGAALAGANIEVVNKNGTTKSVVAGQMVNSVSMLKREHLIY